MLIITENMQSLAWKDERGITQERLAYDLPRTDPKLKYISRNPATTLVRASDLQW